MDADEERVLYLTRLGHEKIIKRGTYDMRNYRPITQNHPFYAYKTIAESEVYFREKAREDEEETMESSESPVVGMESEAVESLDAMTNAADTVNAAGAANTEASGEGVNADALADEILSSNFKVGMSQSEVDEFLKGLLGG